VDSLSHYSRARLEFEMPNLNVYLDSVDREMLRALCSEYDASAAYVLRSLVRLHYAELYKSAPTPGRFPLRPLDHPRDPKTTLAGDTPAPAKV
jgi:hypothetical protein